MTHENPTSRSSFSASTDKAQQNQSDSSVVYGNYTFPPPGTIAITPVREPTAE